MTPDPDVRRIAQEFNLDPMLLQAIVRAEGNIVKAVQCTFPEVATREQALRITCRSIVHRLWEFARNDHAADFVAYMGSKWAPINAANDPTHLNENWVVNVLSGWLNNG